MFRNTVYSYVNTGGFLTRYYKYFALGNNSGVYIGTRRICGFNFNTMPYLLLPQYKIASIWRWQNFIRLLCKYASTNSNFSHSVQYGWDPRMLSEYDVRSATGTRQNIKLLPSTKLGSSINYSSGRMNSASLTPVA